MSDKRPRTDIPRPQDDPAARIADMQRMLDDLPRARAMIADAWLELWAALLDPVWEQLERILRADIAVRARRIATDGLAGTCQRYSG